jgi:hypothetical protein
VSPAGDTIFLVKRADAPVNELVETLFALAKSDEFVKGASTLGYHVC